MLFAYFGPETLLPVTSVIACVAGAVMMFGRVVTQFISARFRSISGRGSTPQPTITVRRSAGRVRVDGAHVVPPHPTRTRTSPTAAETEV